LKAIDVSSDLVARYVDKRQEQKAKNATINRELAALKRMFHLGQKATPPKVNRIPGFPRLAENNIRKGFLEDAQYEKLIGSSSETWFRAIVEVGRTYGWRIGELLSMRVRQVDLMSRTIRLDPGTTKNRDGREVTMTRRVQELMKLCVFGKQPDDFVFTRSNGTPVRDFRGTWEKACEKAGVPRFAIS
jgi:integrase